MNKIWYLYMIRPSVRRCPVQNLTSGFGEIPASIIKEQQRMEYVSGIITIIGTKE